MFLIGKMGVHAAIPCSFDNSRRLVLCYSVFINAVFMLLNQDKSCWYFLFYSEV
jgi:hypothetical protein